MSSHLNINNKLTTASLTTVTLPAMRGGVWCRLAEFSVQSHCSYSYLFLYLSAAWESGALDNVDNRMLIMEDKLSQLSDSFLYDKTTGTESTSDNGGLSIISRPSKTLYIYTHNLLI